MINSILNLLHGEEAEQTQIQLSRSCRPQVVPQITTTQWVPWCTTSLTLQLWWCLLFAQGDATLLAMRDVHASLCVLCKKGEVIHQFAANMTWVRSQKKKKEKNKQVCLCFLPGLTLGKQRQKRPTSKPPVCKIAPVLDELRQVGIKLRSE